MCLLYACTCCAPRQCVWVGVRVGRVLCFGGFAVDARVLSGAVVRVRLGRLFYLSIYLSIYLWYPGTLAPF